MDAVFALFRAWASTSERTAPASLVVIVRERLGVAIVHVAGCSGLGSVWKVRPGLTPGRPQTPTAQIRDAGVQPEATTTEGCEWYAPPCGRDSSLRRVVGIPGRALGIPSAARSAALGFRGAARSAALGFRAGARSAPQGKPAAG